MKVGFYKVGEVYYKDSKHCYYVKVTDPSGKRADYKLAPNREKADSLRCDLVTDLKKKGVPDKDWFFQDLVDLFLDDVKIRKAPLTYRWYRDFLKSFCLTLPKKLKVKDLSNHHVENWLTAKMMPGQKHQYRSDTLSNSNLRV